MKNILRNNNGFSLLEIIVSLAILSIIIIPISSLFINSAKTTNSSNDKIIASSIAQGEMEKIKSQSNLKEKYITKEVEEHEGFLCKINIKKIIENEEDKKNIEIPNEIAIEPTFSEKNDYILFINEDNYYEIFKKTSNLNPKPNIKLTKFKNEPLRILIKYNDNEINKETSIKIEVINKSINSTEIYTEREQNIFIRNELGEIKIHHNYSSKSLNSELYKVIIEVYKGNNKNFIEKIESYKNIVQ